MSVGNGSAGWFFFATKKKKVGEGLERFFQQPVHHRGDGKKRGRKKTKHNPKERAMLRCGE